MKFSIITLAAIFAHQATASAIPQVETEIVPASAKRASCDNTATSRDCWGDFTLNSNYYQTWPDTGVTREYWLEVTNITVAPDGISRQALSFNGTIPGPTISADWGDTLKIHVTNKLENNGTTVHWHGIRQYGTPESDGVPGVTQCPIAPGESKTYEFTATQYGSSWYHSHFALQLGDGLAGPIIINGPATANYDEDLGLLFMNDWFHQPASTHWPPHFGPPRADNGLINGTNIYNNSGVVTGSRWETVFESGTKYRIRLLNAAIEGYIRFAIDDHDFEVIATDLVPIVPYTTNNLVIGIGERYDIVVTANATSGDYWLRAIWETACDQIGATNGILGIVRYNSSSTADPTTTIGDYANQCVDAPYASLNPYLNLDVGTDSEYLTVPENVDFSGKYEMWSINGTSLYLNWSEPTFMDVYNGVETYAASDNVELLNATTDEWIYWILVDDSNSGLNHPMHLHGHDFFMLAQSDSAFDASTASASFNLQNPPRRDTATVPAGGYLALAWQADNPGAWLMHCHIGWHASEGFATQFMERRSEIASTFTDVSGMQDECAAWDDYYPTSVYKQDDSGI